MTRVRPGCKIPSLHTVHAKFSRRQTLEPQKKKETLNSCKSFFRELQWKNNLLFGRKMDLVLHFFQHYQAWLSQHSECFNFSRRKSSSKAASSMKPVPIPLKTPGRWLPPGALFPRH